MVDGGVSLGWRVCGVVAGTGASVSMGGVTDTGVVGTDTRVGTGSGTSGIRVKKGWLQVKKE